MLPVTAQVNQDLPDTIALLYFFRLRAPAAGRWLNVWRLTGYV
jgi:hypothetical protein